MNRWNGKEKTLELMKRRHSVRQYFRKKIEEEKRKELNALADTLNRQSGLHMQVIYDEPDCYESMKAHYGKIYGVSNYIALVGKKGPELDEKAGYYGEQMVLKAQELGLNTCWTALTHGKTRAQIGSDEKLVCVIALGYGANQGKPHKSRPVSQVCNWSDDYPEWVKTGIEAALLAPTAINQQKFYFTIENGSVSARVKGFGFCSQIDLGIVKYHFEAVTGRKVS